MFRFGLFFRHDGGMSKRSPARQLIAITVAYLCSSQMLTPQKMGNTNMHIVTIINWMRNFSHGTFLQAPYGCIVISKIRAW